MWRNASTQMKPGGKLVNVRVTGSLDADYAVQGKYGIAITDLEPFPGGMRYKVHCRTEPPFQIGGCLLDKHADLSSGFNYLHGLGDLETMKPEETEVVKAEKAFWSDFLEKPYFALVVARKP